MDRTIGIAVAAGVALGVLGVVLLQPSPADADRTVVISTAQSRIDRGSFFRLPDAGFSFTMCGSSVQTDGGTAPTLDAPCVDCEGTFNAATAVACRDAWRAANGL